MLLLLRVLITIFYFSEYDEETQPVSYLTPVSILSCIFGSLLLLTGLIFFKKHKGTAKSPQYLLLHKLAQHGKNYHFWSDEKVELQFFFVSIFHCSLETWDRHRSNQSYLCCCQQTKEEKRSVFFILLIFSVCCCSHLCQTVSVPVSLYSQVEKPEQTTKSRMRPLISDRQVLSIVTAFLISSVVNHHDVSLVLCLI